MIIMELADVLWRSLPMKKVSDILDLDKLRAYSGCWLSHGFLMAYAGCGFRHDFLMVYSGYQFSHGYFGLLILGLSPTRQDILLGRM